MTLETRNNLFVPPPDTSGLGSASLSALPSPASPIVYSSRSDSSSGLPDPLARPARPFVSRPSDTLESHPVESQSPDTSRDALASSSAEPPQHPGLKPSLPGTDPSPPFTSPPPPSPKDFAVEVSPAHPGKRSSESGMRMTQSFESPYKKPRLVAPGSLSLPPLPRTPGDPSSTQTDFASHMFYSLSNSSKHVSSRPPSFTALEVAASIMGIVHDPNEGITTLRLPKGQVSAASVSSPAASIGTPSSWCGDSSAMSRSPEGRPLTSPTQLIQGIGVAEFLENDPRPAFIIDLYDTTNHDSSRLRLVYANASLRTARDLLDKIQPDSADPEHNPDFARFKAWVVTFGSDQDQIDTNPTSMAFGRVNWTCSTLRRRFRFVCGDVSPVSPGPASPSPPAQTCPEEGQKVKGTATCDVTRPQLDYFGAVNSPSGDHNETTTGSTPNTPMDESMMPLEELALAASLPLQTTFDWTRIPFDDPNLGPHHRFARSIDWASTSLGPVEEWPPDLRIMSNMIMGSPHPAAMYWGEDHIAIYNEAYIALAGNKHPRMMGQKYEDAWSEIWGEIEPVIKGAWNNGDATMKYDDLLFITRHGFVEETFFNWALIPLVGGDGTVVAIYNPAFENTRRKISERRMLTLREVGVKTSQARDLKGFWAQVQKGLEYNEVDVPFALIYSVDDGNHNESEVSSMHSGSFSNPPQIVLEGSIGVPDGHPSAVGVLDLKLSEDGFAPYMRESMSDLSGPVILSEEDGTLPTHLLQGLTWRGFGDPCRTIVVFPVHPTNAGESIVGFIVLGVNPRRRYDGDYQLFVNLLSRQLATSMASVVLFEEEIKRGQRAARIAALDRQELSIQLHLRTQEAVESEYRFTRMAEFGPVGMFITDGDGYITYCNEMWSKISGHDRHNSPLNAWMQSVRAEDRQGVEAAWGRLVGGRAPITHEFRFKGSRQLQDGHSVDNWVLMSAYPEKDDSGGLKSIFGCITDISQQKWAEDFQKQRRDEAVELKRQQENFIDITSHEMRNPLSAILQCADEISSCLNRYKMGDPSSYSPDLLNVLLDSCMEAANTISLCASHQKRIVDDILTLSKLDSNLLLVTPVDVQPVLVVQNVLKIFETELKSNDITGSFRIDQSYRDLAVDWVKLDPSRLRQVLINLMTNAIKFTQGRPRRSIVISLAASRGASTAGMVYIPSRRPDQDDLTDGADWADGEKLNLHVAVTDTGPGLDDDEKKILFQRFSQVSPRTHVQYGGSGLGLFICRTLTEMQGGQIGVQSQKGQGSTFAFYVKMRRAENPQPDHAASVPTPQMSPAKPPAVVPPIQLATPASVTGGPLLPTTGLNLQQTIANPAKVLDVLIVEDNLVNQKVLQRQLQLSGNHTHVANHGGEALEALRLSRFWDDKKAAVDKRLQIPPPSFSLAGGANKENRSNISVILMDLEMPVMDGMSCTREIRRLEREGIITQHIPIIAVTAYARPEQIENAKVAGVDDVISKPFRIPELIPKIEELVAKYKMLPHGLGLI
ncbi:hypothetical protein OQA88_3577 [Cercophora sp. LCS_1]